MTSLDMNLTYEDALRLSELTGRYNRLDFELDHILTTHGDIIVVAVMIGLIAGFGFMLLYALLATTEQSEGYECSRWYVTENPHWFDTGTVNVRPGPGLCLIVMFSVAIVVSVLGMFIAIPFVETGIMAEQQDLQGQMDAILNRY